jgi:dihydroflavonol-4-reductase
MTNHRKILHDERSVFPLDEGLPMKVLVTGGTGFIGSHMVELLLRKGHEVVCLVRDESSLKHLHGMAVPTVRLDGVKESLTGTAAVDVVIHMAGATRGLDYESYRTANVILTELLLQLCAARQEESPLTRFVLVSSQAAAGPCRTDGLSVTETDASSPVSLYGRSKLEAEQVAASFSACVPLTIIRPPTVFGPRDRDVLGVFQCARRGLAPCLAGPDRVVSIVYVEDLVDGILAAALSPKAIGQTYFLANPEPVVWREFGLTVARVMGYRAVCVPIPLVAMKLAALAGDMVGHLSGSAKLFRSEKLEEMKQIAWICSPDKARQELNWRAATTLEDAVAKTAAWYKKNGWI